MKEKTIEIRISFAIAVNSSWAIVVLAAVDGMCVVEGVEGVVPPEPEGAESGSGTAIVCGGASRWRTPMEIPMRSDMRKTSSCSCVRRSMECVDRK